MTALYNLANEYLKLAETLASADFDYETIGDTIEASGIIDDLSAKAQALEYVARSAEAHNDAIDAEIDRLQALKKHRVAVAKGVRKYLLDNMQRMGIHSISCPLFAIDVMRNPPKVEIIDQLSIPPEYLYTPEPLPPKVDKIGIAEAIKNGKEVPGAQLTQSTRLRIK